jgi:hypothetical protein
MKESKPPKTPKKKTKKKTNKNEISSKERIKQ